MKRSGCVWALVIVLALFFLLYGGVYILTKKAIEQSYEPGGYERYTNLMREKVDFPAEWFEPIDYSSQTVEDGAAAAKLFETLGLANLDYMPLDTIKKNGGLSEREWAGVQSTAFVIQPYQKSLRAFLNHSDFDMDALTKSNKSQQPTISYLSAQVSAKAMMLAAYNHAHQGDFEKAFAANALIFRHAKTHPCSTLIAYLIAAALCDMGASQVPWLVERCEDPAVLKSALEKLKTLQEEANLAPPGHVVLVDWIGAMRQQKMNDDQIEVLPHQKGRYYFRRAQTHFQQPGGGGPDMNWIGAARMLGFGSHVDAFLYQMMVPNFLNATTRLNVARTKMELARIEIASKCFTLEQGRKPSNVAELVPEYLVKAPMDGFAPEGTESPYPKEKFKGRFYSLGPDRFDNLLSVVYDPSNGLMSRGDLAP